MRMSKMRDIVTHDEKGWWGEKRKVNIENFSEAKGGIPIQWWDEFTGGWERAPDDDDDDYNNRDFRRVNR